jgi:hypothetical protein
MLDAPARRAAYELLTRLEHTFRSDRFEDIATGMHGVTWPFLWNEHAIPRLRQSGRITQAEADALMRIGAARARHPSSDDGQTWADIYELMLCLYPVHLRQDAGDGRVYRGQGQAWPLVPTLFRDAPDTEELLRRLNRTYAFIAALCRTDARARQAAESGDPQRFVHLVAVAQHYGLPTHLLDFTRDFRIAAFFACLDAGREGRGSILVLHLAQFRELEGVEGSPYGVCLTDSAPNPRIERQHGLFVAGHDALLFEDTRTDLLERHAFAHSGALAPTGGMDRATLLDASGRDPLAALARRSGAAPRRPSGALARAFDRFTRYATALHERRFKAMGAREYARVCAYAVKPALAPDASPTDVRIARFFAVLQAEIGERADLREWFKFPGLARHAFEAYLETPGEIEARLAAGLRPYLDRCNAAEQTIVRAIVDRHIEALASGED